MILVYFREISFTHLIHQQKVQGFGQISMLYDLLLLEICQSCYEKFAIFFDSVYSFLLHRDYVSHFEVSLDYCIG